LPEKFIPFLRETTSVWEKASEKKIENGKAIAKKG
jgi:hypothetical protein